jgi:Short C-terminal domain
MFRRRRPLARAAIVGGTAYAVGKHVQGGRDADAAAAEEAPPEAEAAAESTDDVYNELERLAELKDKGVLTDAEFEVQKAKLLERT